MRLPSFPSAGSSRFAACKIIAPETAETARPKNNFGKLHHTARLRLVGEGIEVNQALLLFAPFIEEGSSDVPVFLSCIWPKDKRSDRGIKSDQKNKRVRAAMGPLPFAREKQDRSA